MKPNSQIDHVYAIFRVDEFLGDVPLDRKITVKKVVRSAELAKTEVDRLNQMQKDDGVFYLFQVTRLEKPEASIAQSQIDDLHSIAKEENPTLS